LWWGSLFFFEECIDFFDKFFWRSYGYAFFVDEGMEGIAGGAELVIAQNFVVDSKFYGWGCLYGCFDSDEVVKVGGFFKLSVGFEDRDEVVLLFKFFVGDI